MNVAPDTRIEIQKDARNEWQTRVLVVDDNPDACGFLARALSGETMSVHAAHSGLAAIDAMDRFQPDAVLLDVDMPGMDGFATCEALLGRHADLPVIFMTGLGDTEHIVRGFEVGACDYVTKPVAIPEVLARVRSHAAKARVTRSAREAILRSSVPMMGCGGGRLLWVNEGAQALLGKLPVDISTGQLLDDAFGIPIGQLRDEQGGDTARLQNLELRRLTGAGAAVMVLELAAWQGGSGHTRDATPYLGGATLTPREAEVMAWVARGKTNRDVADILGMSPRTVNKHLEHIYEKFGVETRTAAVAMASRSRDRA